MSCKKPCCPPGPRTACPRPPGQPGETLEAPADGEELLRLPKVRQAGSEELRRCVIVALIVGDHAFPMSGASHIKWQAELVEARHHLGIALRRARVVALPADE